MTMDPANAVVRLCGAGMRAEAEGRADAARELFAQAWETAADDYEKCVAAHYVARHQPTPEDTLRWNQECLDRAALVGDERVAGFYPSLHLNLAKAHADLDHPDQARDHYERSAARLRDLPPGPYTDGLRYAVADGLRSAGVTAPRTAEPHLTKLISALTGRGELRALALILPAYLGDLGTDEDKLRLTTALTMVHASRQLPEDEQLALGKAIAALS